MSFIRPIEKPQEPLPEEERERQVRLMFTKQAAYKEETQ